MDQNQTFSIMLFILGLFLIGLGTGLAAMTQTAISMSPIGTTYRTFQPYATVGAILIAFGVIILIGVLIGIRRKRTTPEKTEKRKRRKKKPEKNLTRT